MPRILTIIPAFNEEAAIGFVVKQVRTSLPETTVLVIDDGSTDETGSTASRAGAAVLTLAHNLGIGGAVQAGYRWAALEDYDVVLRLDADGQHDPALADGLIEPVVAGEVDVTVGSRFVVDVDMNHQPPPLRRMGIAMFSRLVSLMVGQRITDPTSGFRCVNRAVARYSAQHHPEDFPEVESLVHYHKAGFSIREVPMMMQDRHHGESSIRGWRSLNYAVKVSLALLVLSLRRSGRKG